MSKRIGQSWITSRIAMCYDCDWRNESQTNALNATREHYKKTGHKVCCETGRVTYYGLTP